MGAETTVYCRVLKAHEEWIEVSAVTLAEAREKVAAMPGVIQVLDAEYEPEQDEPRDQY